MNSDSGSYVSRLLFVGNCSVLLVICLLIFFSITFKNFFFLNMYMLMIHNACMHPTVQFSPLDQFGCQGWAGGGEGGM